MRTDGILGCTPLINWDNFWLWSTLSNSWNYQWPELIPELLAPKHRTGVLGPDASVNNYCRASIQWFWDRVTKLVSAPLRTAASWSRKIMSRQLENYGINILQLHAEWLLANGYKLQAKSCKRQIRMILKKKFLKKRQAPSFKLDSWCRI